MSGKINFAFIKCLIIYCTCSYFLIHCHPKILCEDSSTDNKEILLRLMEFCVQEDADNTHLPSSG